MWIIWLYYQDIYLLTTVFVHLLVEFSLYERCYLFVWKNFKGMSAWLNIHIVNCELFCLQLSLFWVFFNAKYGFSDVHSVNCNQIFFNFTISPHFYRICIKSPDINCPCIVMYFLKRKCLLFCRQWNKSTWELQSLVIFQ